MVRPYLSACLGLLLALDSALPTATAETPALAEGNWKLTVFGPPFSQETTYCLIKVGNKDSKVTASVLAVHPALQGLTIKRFAIEKSTVRADLKSPTLQLTFEGRISPKDNKTILGSLDNESRLLPARLTVTKLITLERNDLTTQSELPPLRRLGELSRRGLELRIQALREKDADKKLELEKQALAAAKELSAQTPKLYDEVLEKHTDHPAAPEIGILRLRAADPERVKPLAQQVEKSAELYGPRLQRQTQAELAQTLASLPKSTPFALEYAQRVAQGMNDQYPASIQIQVVKALHSAQTKLNMTSEARQTAAWIAKLDAILDTEYLRKVPPFQPDTFKGRTGKGNRAVVMELFTGAQCPPCVAADVAFDALEKSYKPTELILIEYHLHIPGPDPLTNKDSEARWEYYRKAYPLNVRGTPTTLFNGKQDGGGGGAMAQAHAKYQEYRKVIDPLVEDPEAARLKATASRRGDKIDIQVEVADLKDPGESKKLRLVLVEESIRYLGGNKIRFHHHVVRALPGGAEGMSLLEKTSSHTAAVDLGELRTGLTHYLEDFATQRPFANPDRPLDLKKLHVIALVQDDMTNEILQGLQIGVPED